MPKLWVFGDSFSAPYKIPVGKEWPALWADKSGYELENFSRSGTSNNFIYFEYARRVGEIKADDRIIIAWSNRYRHTILGNPTGRKKNHTFRPNNRADPHSDEYFADFFSIETEDNTLSMAVNGAKNLAPCPIAQFSGHDDFGSTTITPNDMMDITERMYNVKTAQQIEHLMVKLPRTGCLLHEWMLMQIEEAKKHDAGFQASDYFDEDYVHYTYLLFHKLNNLGCNWFIDTWHLNETGHQRFAEVVDPILVETFSTQWPL